MLDIQRLSIIGVGLLGGSVARAVRRSTPNVHIVGVSRSHQTRQSAVELGVVDSTADSISDGCRGSDVVVVCTPVDGIAKHVRMASAASADHTLITDVGSTKAAIVEAVSQHTDAARKFVAAHPIAGSEKTGVQASRADLFDGKAIVITPGEDTDEELLGRAEVFWTDTGGHVHRMTPAQHDEQLAAVSHVPHVFSSLVAYQTPADALPLTGSGWRDITRVAAGNPEMWTAIVSENRRAILRCLNDSQIELEKLRSLIESADDEAVRQWFSVAKSRREQA